MNSIDRSPPPQSTPATTSARRRAIELQLPSVLDPSGSQHPLPTSWCLGTLVSAVLPHACVCAVPLMGVRDLDQLNWRRFLFLNKKWVADR